MSFYNLLFFSDGRIIHKFNNAGHISYYYIFQNYSFHHKLGLLFSLNSQS